MEQSNKPIVELIAHSMPTDGSSLEKIVAAAGKLCYSSVSTKQLYDGLNDMAVEKFINLLTDIGHESPFEHVSFTFTFDNVSRAFLAQVSRHRIASFSVQSQRYVNLEKTFEYITPPICEEEEKLKAMYDGIIEACYRSYAELTKMFMDHLIEKYNMDPRDAEKRAIEDARYVLPNACATKMVCTFNTRSLYNFFALRLCNRAQWEIRNVANEMLELVLGVAPLLFAKAGPSCTFGTCKEGKMCCGQRIEPKEAQRTLALKRA